MTMQSERFENTNTLLEGTPNTSPGFFVFRLEGRLTNRWLVFFQCADGGTIDLCKYRLRHEAKEEAEYLTALRGYDLYDCLYDALDISLRSVERIVDEYAAHLCAAEEL